MKNAHYELNYILTRELNQDVLENLLSLLKEMVESAYN